MLYELCTLKHVFESTSLLGLVYKIANEPYSPLPDQSAAEPLLPVAEWKGDVHNVIYCSF